MARVHVFPPPFITSNDLDRFSRLDREFGERLAQYCARRAPGETARERLEIFCSTLVNMVMGLMVNGIYMDSTLMGREIEKSVSFMLRALIV